MPPPAAAGSSSGVAAEAGGGEGGGEGGGASDGGGEGGVDNGGEEANGDGGLVDDEWKRVPGGPFVARLMCRSRQPVARASYRNFNVAVPFDPIEGPLEPGGEIKFPIVAGAPAEGITCKLPDSWGADKEVLHFKLKLNKAGATEPTVTIASAFHRPPPDDVEEQEQQLAGAIDLTAGEPALNAEAAEAADEAEAEAEAEGAEEENGEAVAAAEAEADVAAAGSGNDEDDGLPDWVIEQTERRVASKPAAAASSVSVQPQSPEVQPEVEAEEEAEEEAGDEDTAPTLTDEEIAARLEGLHCVWHDDNQEQLDGTTETDLNGVVELLKAIGAEACVLVVPGTTYEIQRSICGARHFTVSSEPNEVEPEVDNGQGERSRAEDNVHVLRSSSDLWHVWSQGGRMPSLQRFNKVCGRVGVVGYEIAPVLALANASKNLTLYVYLASRNTNTVFGFSCALKPSATRISLHRTSASGTDREAASKPANVMSVGSHVSSTCSRCTTISSPGLHGNLIRSLSTVTTNAPSQRTHFTLHQNRSPCVPTLMSVPAYTTGCLTLLLRTSKVCCRSLSAALAMLNAYRHLSNELRNSG